MTNGQVERANGMILQGLKPRIYNDLNKFGKRWMKELPSVVWSLRTTPSRATSFSPFFLVYGAESLRRYHARGVRPRGFQVGDLVLRLQQDARGRHKLTPP
jgi:hypothetical protein